MLVFLGVDKGVVLIGFFGLWKALSFPVSRNIKLYHVFLFIASRPEREARGRWGPGTRGPGRGPALANPGPAGSTAQPGEGEPRAGLVLSREASPPLALPAPVPLPAAHHLAFSSASTARRSTVLNRVFMVR